MENRKKVLQMSLKKKWFEMTKEGVKTEDYREITPYWAKRLTFNDIGLDMDGIMYALCALRDGYAEEEVEQHYGLIINKFDFNKMTLGYPKSTDTSRVLNLEHKGIDIRTGNPEWGAEEGKVYFVIKHGLII